MKNASFRRTRFRRIRRWLAVPLLPAAMAGAASDLGATQEPDHATDRDPDYLGTYSIIARDPDTGELGMGVQSKAFAAGNRAMHARGGVAVIAHQAAANPMYGGIGLELLEAGYSPEEALNQMVAGDEGRERRQVAILDIRGRTAAWTGTGASDWKGHRCGVDYCAQGNILTGPEVVDAMAESFEGSSGPLAERLLDALDAAQAAGGDARGMQSGAILVVRPRVGGGFSDRAIDIRVDDHQRPLAELRRLLDKIRSGEMLSEARRLAREGELSAALRQAQEAAFRSQDNDNAWMTLAEIHAGLEMWNETIESLQRAVALNQWRRAALADHPGFEPLRDDPRFRELVRPR